MNGSMACGRARRQPQQERQPDAAAQPMTKPSADTRKVAMVSVRSLPFAAISTMRCAVASGGAKNSGPNARAPHSQASSSATPSAIRPPVTIHCRGMAWLSGRSEVISALLIARPPGCVRRSPRSPAS